MLPTLLDIAIATGVDRIIGLIDETTKAHPELRLVPARPLRGRRYKTRVRTALGRITGSFRDANEGTTPITHVYENREVETYTLEAQFGVDKAVADSYEDGATAYIASELEGIMEGETQGLSRQFYYGTGAGGNVKGFPGLIQAYDATNMVVDAGGTTASTGSSCWLIKTGLKEVIWRWGEGGSLSLPQPRIERIRDPNDSSKEFTGYVTELVAYPGLQVGSLRSVVRIKKLTADTGKGMTDALIAAALAKLEVGMKPDLILMSRRSSFQLQTSRTVVINTGPGANVAPSVGAVAPPPDSAFGIPIHVTDAILDTESLTL